VKIAHALLLSGADPSCPGCDGRTPLWLAAHSDAPGCAEIVADIINFDPGARQGLGSKILEARSASTGTTALIAAASKGHADIVKALLEGGAEIDAVNDGGCDALHAACVGGHISAVDALLHSSATRPSAMDSVSGFKRLLKLTRRAGHSDVADLIYSAFQEQLPNQYTGCDATFRSSTSHHRAVEEAESRTSYQWLQKIASTSHHDSSRRARIARLFSVRPQNILVPKPPQDAPSGAKVAESGKVK
jgi:hypothetical protein